METGLSLAFSEIPKTVFLASQPISAFFICYLLTLVVPAAKQAGLRSLTFKIIRNSKSQVLWGAVTQLVEL